MDRSDDVGDHDGDIFVVCAPVAKGRKPAEDLKHAVKYAVGYIMHKFPNVEFGFTFR
jgi:hypothetical protein